MLGLYENIIKSQVYQDHNFLYYLNFFNDGEIYKKIPQLFKSLLTKLEESKIYDNGENSDQEEMNESNLY